MQIEVINEDRVQYWHAEKLWQWVVQTFLLQVHSTAAVAHFYDETIAWSKTYGPETALTIATIT